MLPTRPEGGVQPLRDISSRYSEKFRDDMSNETSLQSGKQPAFAALHHRNFRFFFVGTMLAMLGDNIEHVVSD